SCAEVGEEIRRNTRAYNAALERLILRHPEQWYWVHRRWKRIDPPARARRAEDRVDPQAVLGTQGFSRRLPPCPPAGCPQGARRIRETVTEPLPSDRIVRRDRDPHCDHVRSAI